jgi:hypothetical protein
MIRARLWLRVNWWRVVILLFVVAVFAWQTPWLTPLAAFASATTFKWVATSSRGNQLTTELNSLANGAYSAASTAYDNTSNLDEWGALDITLASLNPTAGAYLQIFLVVSLDGTTYQDVPSSTNPGFSMSAVVVELTTGSAAKRVMTPLFRIPPTKFKFILLNKSNVALGASSNTVALYTANEQSV